MMLKNDLLLRAARGEKTERTPVWVMRQAGRILPEYLAVRNSLSGFIELVKSPDLAAEVTIQPVDILGVDAAIIFSDILVIPEAMGLPYTMEEKKGPFFPQTIDNETDLKRLKIADEDGFGYVSDAIKVTKKELNNRVPLIGFAGAPWTIFCYMVEGRGSKTFSKPRKMLYAEPVFAQKLLDMITRSTINYLKSQVAAGADIVQVFDSWAGILSDHQYEEFSVRYLRQIADAIPEVPVILFSKGALGSLHNLSETSCNVIGLDWNMDIKKSREAVGASKTLQGNLDPAVLYGSFEVVKKETRRMIDEFGLDRHIANLGHGVYPDISADKVKCFIDEVKEYSQKQRSS